ncbi:class I SAM-dependent methyltransferase [Paenibacillus sp. PAMC21692]|uniref:methyltransferase domain-containing protein n=1 Tax=Paenibacillus sp. PAMC21692 TaxID=2762320 RepID=UPI00164E6C7C|nr:class I SAM-dependent methyltransferase [Paenibacillus sp. PAMC21692]QNK54680.1 class I SAM-dependent methyltransferase [Paenibacillus sp. PAMC21692]
MERKNTFNEIANEYDKYRPPYPEQLFRDILEFAELKANNEILEIGCGTGLAPTGFVNLGYSNITAIELGENLAELTRQKFRNKQGVKIINSQFETWNHENEKFNLAISGTAFHFVQPQEFGYRKVFDLLRDQGTIGFFWTVHVPSYIEPYNEIREIYRKYDPQLDDTQNPSLEQIIKDRSKLTLMDGLFKDLEVKQYTWDHHFTASEYISLLNTNSRHRLVPEDVRNELFGEIREVIERYGGNLVKPQAVVLFLAKKRP